MGIRVNSNFDVQSKLYMDSKQQFATVAEMAAYNTNLIPNGFITFVDETGANYQYLEINEVDPELGKWRKFSAADGVINDELATSKTNTYSIDKIRELLKLTGGLALVQTLPDLSNEDGRKSVDIQKIYLVPNTNESGENVHDEYVCVYVPASPDVYRVPAVESEQDYNTWKNEIQTYVAGGGNLLDGFSTYSASVTMTTMTEAQYKDMTESIGASDADYGTYASRIGAIIVTPAVEESWDWELLGSISADNLVFGDFTTNNTVGKVKAGTSLLNKNIIDVVKDMLSKDIAPTITLTGSPVSTTLNEKGTTIADVALTAVVTVGTAVFADGTNVVFKKAGVAISTQPFSKDTLTYTFTDTGANLADTTEYTAEIAYKLADVDDTATSKITYKFALPMFYGISATNTVTDPTALTKIVSDATAQKLTYTAANEYCVFAIPAALSIKSLKDANGFENIDSWTSTTVSVTIGADHVDYKVYASNTPVTCTGFVYNATLA